jgi:hypothetical protein
MQRACDTTTKSALGLFWTDLRRPATYHMLVLIVALSMKLYAIYV